MKADLQSLSFEGATEWLNRKADTRQTRGHPTLVHFWSTSSETSKTNLSQVAALRDHRKREGLRVVAVHVPQSESERSARAVRDAIDRLNLTEPCALDNDHRLSAAFLNESLQPDFSHKSAQAQRDSPLASGSLSLGPGSSAGESFAIPAYYLFDIDGELRSAATGTNALDTVEDELDQLFLELRSNNPFCPACELFLNKEAMFCSDCGSPLTLPGSAEHPYYEDNYYSALPTIRLGSPDPRIGHQIDGKYELLARLGEGGMSVVYRARRIHIGDDVAVKILTGKYVKDDAALARFKREARAAAMLRHPNVITIHDFGETDDEHAPAFIVMEFVKGSPLRELLHSENHFSVERGVRLMRGICAGVGAAHRQRVVHRDLKPENILVVAADDDFEIESVRVVDFGLAKLLADAGATVTGAVVGTPFYMSPEQCLGEPLDARSDVYSLGAMFYEMLSGTRPFAADTVSGVINRHLSEPPPPFAASLGIPRRISIGIMHALAKDPDDRPQNATELARQMQLV